MEKINRNRNISIRFTKEGRDLLGQLAKEFGLSMAATIEMLIREKIRERAKQTVYVER